MTPDDDNDGVPVSMIAGRIYDKAGVAQYLREHLSFETMPEPYLAFTTLRAEQLLAGERALDAIRPADLRAVIEAACGLPRGDNSTVTLGHAVARLTIALDALRPAAPGTPE